MKEREDRGVPDILLLPGEYATQECGVVDPAARVPELVHYDCKGCHNAVRALLLSRKSQGPKAPTIKQSIGPWMDPIKP